MSNSNNMWYGRGRDYQQAIEEANDCRDHAELHRQKWLSLRKQMRNYFSSLPSDIVIPEEIKKLIGMK